MAKTHRLTHPDGRVVVLALTPEGVSIEITDEDGDKFVRNRTSPRPEELLAEQITTMVSKGFVREGAPAAPKAHQPAVRRRGGNWIRVVDDELLAVEARAGENGDGWHVYVGMAELVREEPLESAMRDGIAAALKRTSGVTSVEEEDREVWFVEGTMRGSALVTAVGRVVDRLADEAR